MRDASTGRPVLADSASLAASEDSTAQQDGDAEPQARDERPIVIGSQEHTEEPDRNDIETWREAYKNNPLIRVPVQKFQTHLRGVEAVDGRGRSGTRPCSRRTFEGLKLALGPSRASSHIVPDAPSRG